MSQTILLQQLVNGVSLGGVYALMAVGFGIIFNVLKFSNFSHSGVVAACAYLGFFITTRLTQNLWLALILTTIAGGLIGILVEKLVFRPIRIQRKPLTYLFVNSITIAMLVQQFLSARWGRFNFAYPQMLEKTVFEIGTLIVSRSYMIMLLISALVLVALSLFLQKTRTGIAVRAASTDIYTPALMGVNTDFIIMITFAIAGLLAGVTGFFLGMTYSLTPFIGSLILKGIIASIIGGMGSLGGGIIAGILLGVVEALLIAEIGASITPIVVYTGIVVLLLVRPQGIAGKLVSVKA